MADDRRRLLELLADGWCYCNDPDAHDEECASCEARRELEILDAEGGDGDE